MTWSSDFANSNQTDVYNSTRKWNSLCIFLHWTEAFHKVEELKRGEDVIEKVCMEINYICIYTQQLLVFSGKIICFAMVFPSHFYHQLCVCSLRNCSISIVWIRRKQLIGSCRLMSAAFCHRIYIARIWRAGHWSKKCVLISQMSTKLT